ncbi:hypothetical protein ACWE42_06455 [Sutcliffiella cohnii]
MKRKIIKKVGIFIMLMSIFNLLGCSYVDKQQAAKFESLLEEKYNKEFTVTHIGGRYGTANNDTVTSYVHPIDNEDLVFMAQMTKEGELVSDSYIPMSISKKINRILKEELKKVGLESETLTLIVNADSSLETNAEITLEEYITTYSPKHFSATMIVKETPNLSEGHFEEALFKVYEELLNTHFQVHVHVISEEEFEECQEKFKGLPRVANAWFTDYTVKDEMKLLVDFEGFQVFDTKKKW